jgi:hypothetical protein
MKRTLLALAVAGLLNGALASAAAASGPAGKNTVEVQCEGIGTITVRVPPNEHGKGAGQAVAQHLHGIVVSSTFSFTDVTTGKEIGGGTETKGNGHHNASTTACKGMTFEGEAAQVFGEEELPEGVSPTDIVRGEFEVHVVLKR